MLITIVTVTYNAEGTLERTLKSVEMQTHGNVEHIIMDGASKDGTLAIAQAYKERNDDRDIRIVSEPDKGLYDAMNKAIAIANGEYICFLNAGDKLHNPQTLEFIVHIAQHNPDAGVIYGDTDIVDDNGMKLRERRLSPLSASTGVRSRTACSCATRRSTQSEASCLPMTSPTVFLPTSTGA